MRILVIAGLVTCPLVAGLKIRRMQSLPGAHNVWDHLTKQLKQEHGYDEVTDGAAIAALSADASEIMDAAMHLFPAEQVLEAVSVEDPAVTKYLAEFGLHEKGDTQQAAVFGGKVVYKKLRFAVISLNYAKDIIRLGTDAIKEGLTALSNRHVMHLASALRESDDVALANPLGSDARKHVSEYLQEELHLLPNLTTPMVVALHEADNAVDSLSAEQQFDKLLYHALHHAYHALHHAAHPPTKAGEADAGAKVTTTVIVSTANAPSPDDHDHETHNAAWIAGYEVIPEQKRAAFLQSLNAIVDVNALNMDSLLGEDKSQLLHADAFKAAVEHQITHHTGKIVSPV